jgi:hypothetical protein
MVYTEYNAPFYEHFDNLFKTSTCLKPRLDQMLLLQCNAGSLVLHQSCESGNHSELYNWDVSQELTNNSFTNNKHQTTAFL